MAIKPTERFSNRADNYHSYRPNYPPNFIKSLDQLSSGSTAKIAEIGSGTGILTTQLLNAGWQVLGVEPNDAMRSRAESQLKSHASFRSVKGSAEATSLADHTVDMIIAAQAFHWFQVEEARTEFMRILKAGGEVVLVWNIRQDSTAFLKEYEQFLHTYSTDYALVDHQRFDEVNIKQFFRNQYQTAQLSNPQLMDWQQLWGYYQSCSYALPQEHALYQESESALKRIFDEHAENGKINMLYRTNWYRGPLADA